MVVELVKFFLAVIGGAGVALLAAAWLAKAWINHQLTKALEDYKTGLIQKTETLKTELSIYAHEQNVGLSRIDAQRSEAIQAIWRILCDWQEHLIPITAPNPPRGNALRAYDFYRHHSVQLMNQAQKLSIQVRDFAIYFDQASFEVISRCGMALSNATADYYQDAGLEGAAPPATLEEAEARLAVFREGRDSLAGAAGRVIEVLRAALLKEMRRLLKAERD